jgi:hypothetical protein
MFSTELRWQACVDSEERDTGRVLNGTLFPLLGSKQTVSNFKQMTKTKLKPSVFPHWVKQLQIQRHVYTNTYIYTLLRAGVNSLHFYTANASLLLVRNLIGSSHWCSLLLEHTWVWKCMCVTGLTISPHSICPDLGPNSSLLPTPAVLPYQTETRLLPPPSLEAMRFNNTMF